MERSNAYGAKGWERWSGLEYALEIGFCRRLRDVWKPGGRAGLRTPQLYCRSLKTCGSL